MEEEISQLEHAFNQAMVANDTEAVSRFLADDWVIIDPDGGIIDKARFLGVIKSGALTHESMESDDMRIRVYNDTAVVTARTVTQGSFLGSGFTSVERSTDVFIRSGGHWQCVFSQLTRLGSK